jgi:hypothetical protein
VPIIFLVVMRILARGSTALILSEEAHARLGETWSKTHLSWLVASDNVVVVAK